MKKIGAIFVTIVCLQANLIYSIHPRAESAITSLQSGLQQLKLKYNQSLAQSIQNTINLLKLYEPAIAQDFQTYLQQLQGQQASAAESNISEPQPEPIAIPVSPRPIIVEPTKPLPVQIKTEPVSAQPTITRPLPIPSQDEQLKNRVSSFEHRILTQLQSYVPTIKGKKFQEIQSLVPTTLKEGIRGISGKNARIKSNTKDVAAQTAKGFDISQLPSIDGLIDSINSADNTIKLYTILYGSKAAEPISNYFTDIKTDFVTVTFENAIERIRYIRQIINDIGSLRTAFGPEEINYTLTSLMRIHRMITELESLHLVYITRYMQDTQNSSKASTQLDTQSEELLETLKNVLAHIKIAFDEVSQNVPLSIKIMQRHSYELIGLSTQIVARALPVSTSQAEDAELNLMIQNTLAQMTTTILQLRVAAKK